MAQPIIALAENAAKLRISTDPPMDRLVHAVLASPTTDIPKAQSIFEVGRLEFLKIYLPQYMATRLGHSMPSSMDRLQSAPFIPVKTEKEVRLTRPVEVYFSPRDGNNHPFRSAFTFVDFGERANVFLRNCGVHTEPSVKGMLPTHRKLMVRYCEIVDARAAADA